MQENKKEVLEEVLKIWEENPHLRLLQLIVNARFLDLQNKNQFVASIPDFFYLTDEELIKVLKEFSTNKAKL